MTNNHSFFRGGEWRGVDDVKGKREAGCEKKMSYFSSVCLINWDEARKAFILETA